MLVRLDLFYFMWMTLLGQVLVYKMVQSTRIYWV